MTLRQRYDEAVAFGITHNWHRDWHDGNHPGYARGCWLRDYAGQVWLFTREPAVDWCHICSYLDSASARGLTALDAVTSAINGKGWLPLPAI